MNEQELYEMLKKAQEPKGYFFNKDRDRVNDLLTGLLFNKETIRLYGLPLPTGLRRPESRSGHHLSLYLPNPGCGGFRQLLL